MNIELEKLKLHRQKVDVAKSEMLFKIMEREADVTRLRKDITIQDNKIEELNKEIKELDHE
jgi:hypothetical protein